jgi:hypothetical protein
MAAALLIWRFEQMKLIELAELKGGDLALEDLNLGVYAVAHVDYGDGELSVEVWGRLTDESGSPRTVVVTEGSAAFEAPADGLDLSAGMLNFLAYLIGIERHLSICDRPA